MTFGYLWALLAVWVEQWILDHAYDKYSVLAKKPGMTGPNLGIVPASLSRSMGERHEAQPLVGIW
jgi:hypothetical protein